MKSNYKSGAQKWRTNKKPLTIKRKWLIFNKNFVARPGFEPGTSGL